MRDVAWAPGIGLSVRSLASCGEDKMVHIYSQVSLLFRAAPVTVWVQGRNPVPFSCSLEGALLMCILHICNHVFDAGQRHDDETQNDKHQDLQLT